MANPFGIAERTIEQLATATDSINVVGGVDGRKSVYEPLVCIVTDHADGSTPTYPDNTGTPNDEKELNEKAVIFMSIRHGEPWVRGSNVDVGIQHKIHKPTDTILGMPKDVTVVYPDFDYSTFE